MIGTVCYALTTLLAIIVTTMYVYKKWKWSYWSRRGLETYEPKFMDIGSQYYKSYFYFKKKGLKHGGTYLFFHPHYIPADINLIKRILISDFDTFVNRGLFEINLKEDDLNAHLFNLKDQKWKNLRAKLSPTFTSGKLKMMFQTLADTTWGLEKVFKEFADTKQTFEMKDVLARYTTDVIGSTAFGLEINSLENPKSEFRMFGKAIMDDIDSITTPLFLFSSLPSFVRKFMSILMKKKTEEAMAKNFDAKNFFKGIVKDTVEYRENNNIQRNDFLHLLLLLKHKGTVEDEISTQKNVNVFQEKLTLAQIAAQCFVFFIGGYDTSSTTMTFALYELAKNQEIQDKLREEIHEALGQNNGKISYDMIHQMSYLDQVVHETLRKYSPVRFLSRKCKQDYPVPGTNFTLKKGEQVLISTEAIHHDPDLYPEPHKFDPERFSPENKAKMNSVQFLPFGEGPRMCIGSRFGLMQTKVGLTSILNKFRVTLNEKTQEPLNLTKSFLSYAVIGGIWFNAEAV